MFQIYMYTYMFLIYIYISYTHGYTLIHTHLCINQMFIKNVLLIKQYFFKKDQN